MLHFFYFMYNFVLSTKNWGTMIKNTSGTKGMFNTLHNSEKHMMECDFDRDHIDKVGKKSYDDA